MGDEGRELFYLTAVEEADGTAGLSGLFFIVGHHHDGASVFFIQLMQQLHDFRTHLGVQVTGGSSASIISGLPMMARAMATRWH